MSDKTIVVSSEIHKEIKIKAAELGISIKEYVEKFVKGENDKNEQQHC